MTTTKIAIEPPTYEVRLSPGARQALYAHNNNGIDRPPSADGTPVVTLRCPPPGLVVTRIQGSLDVAVRCADEARWPGEVPAAWHENGDWVPCPRCDAALVWYEANYVPGWRICLSGHHAQLAGDGRTAEAK